MQRLSFTKTVSSFLFCLVPCLSSFPYVGPVKGEEYIPEATWLSIHSVIVTGTRRNKKGAQRKRRKSFGWTLGWMNEWMDVHTPQYNSRYSLSLLPSFLRVEQVLSFGWSHPMVLCMHHPQSFLSALSVANQQSVAHRSPFLFCVLSFLPTTVVSLFLSAQMVLWLRRALTAILLTEDSLHWPDTWCREEKVTRGWRKKED